MVVDGANECTYKDVGRIVNHRRTVALGLSTPATIEEILRRS